MKTKCNGSIAQRAIKIGIKIISQNAINLTTAVMFNMTYKSKLLTYILDEEKKWINFNWELGLKSRRLGMNKYISRKD